MNVERVDLEAIIDLRWRVLRAGLPRESALFDGDREAMSAHFAARGPGGEVVGCVSLHARPVPAEAMLDPRCAEMLENAPAADPARARQLRGMAVAPQWRGTGLGAALLRAAEGQARAEAQRAAVVPVMWCNARHPAVPFYGRHGWVVISETFEVPTAGPHRRMLRLP